MKIHTGFEQNSLAWLQARAGVVTASEFDNLFTNKLEPRKGQMVETFLSRKVAEAWLNGPLPGYNTIEMEMGKILEEEAVPWYEFEFGETIDRVAFITTDDGKVGCSPDGLIGDDGGIEIKCPMPHTHVSYLLDCELPECYAPQVHGSMFVTGRSWWRFLSYRRGFPNLVKLVERDEAIQSRIAETLATFLERLEKAMKQMEEMAGHARPVKTFGFSEQTKQQPQSSNDIIP